MDWSWIVVAISVLGSLVAGGLGQHVRRRRRRRRRKAADGHLECALRVSSGQVRGLSVRWRQGTAELRAGGMTFRRFLHPEPSAPTVHLDGVVQHPDATRKVTPLEYARFDVWKVHTLSTG